MPVPSRCAFLLSLCLVIPEWVIADPEAGDSVPQLSAEVSLDTWQPPQRIDESKVEFPPLLRWFAQEGWVELNFMVDPQGKPYEVTVTDSTGNEGFREAAVEALNTWRFKPAEFEGKAIDSGLTMHVAYERRSTNDMHTIFHSDLERISRMLGNGNLEGARNVVERLQPRTLQDDGVLALMKYEIARAEGDKAAQIQWLRRALSREITKDGKLRRVMNNVERQRAYSRLADLESEAKDFASALKTATTLRGFTNDEKLQKSLDRFLAEIETLRDSAPAYGVDGEIGASANWNYALFRKQFLFEDVVGEIAEFKLRCERQFVGVRFKPEIEYSVAPDAGECQLEVIGDPKTTFKLVQF